MFERAVNLLRDVRDRQRIAVALAKGGAMMQARRIDLTDPGSWEFSGFSQNGEDGVLDVLRSQLSRSNRYFIEIGGADGLENNSAWLLVAEKFGGLMIEGDRELSARARRIVEPYSIGAECIHLFVTTDAAGTVKSRALHADPDVLSLDIDGNDYYIARALLDSGLRPKIVVVEYNAVFGPERSATIQYATSFNFRTAHPTELYYGVSVAAWRRFFASHGYRFVTVERNGVNAFFVDPSFFDEAFLNTVCGVDFAENLYQLKKFRKPHYEQFKLIEDQKLVQV
jgi:hypothetical protein